MVRKKYKIDIKRNYNITDIKKCTCEAKLILFSVYFCLYNFIIANLEVFKVNNIGEL